MENGGRTEDNLENRWKLQFGDDLMCGLDTLERTAEAQGFLKERQRAGRAPCEWCGRIDGEELRGRRCRVVGGK